MKQLLLTISALLFATAVCAEGYQVNTLSAKQLGMGHVGTGMKLNSESIYFNPAGTAFQTSRFSFSVGITGIKSNATYLSNNDYRGNPQIQAHSDNKISTPLYAYFNYKATKNLAVGLGFYTPYGSSMNWGDNWSGSHLIQQINLAAYTFQPTVSFRICDRLSVGAGLMLTWGNFDLSRAMLPIGTGNKTLAQGFNTIGKLLPALGAGAGLSPEEIARYQAMAQQGETYFTDNLQDKSIVSAKLEGNANLAVGVNAGILWDVTDEWSIAMSYRSRMDMKVDKGTAQLIYASQESQQLLSFLNQMLQTAGQPSAIPALDKGTFHTQLALPTTVTWGVSYRPNDKWRMGVDLQWIGWSAYKDLNVSFNEKELGIKDIYSVKNYSNTLSARFGAEYDALDWLAARVGIYYDESPVDSNYLNPETPSMTKLAYTAGVTFRPCKWMHVDLAYGYVNSADPERTGSYPYVNSVLALANEQIKNVAPEYPTTSAITDFSGNYTARAHTFSIGVGFSF